MTNEKKKSGLVIAIIVVVEILFVALIIGGYNLLKNNSKNDTSNSNTNSNTNNGSNIRTNTYYVGDGEFEKKPVEATYTDRFGETYTFASKLPTLYINSDDAKKFNLDMKKKWEEHVKKYDNCVKIANDYSPRDDGLISCNTEVVYSSEENDNMVSILLLETYKDYNKYYNPKYTYYFFDKKNGKKLSIDSVFEYSALSKDEIVNKVMEDYEGFLTNNVLSANKEDKDKTKKNILTNGAFFIDSTKGLGIVYEAYAGNNGIPFVNVLVLQ